MQSYPFFFPNYPPPAVPTRESIISEGLKAFEQAKNDERWLRSWMERKRSSKQMSLSDYRQRLTAHAQLFQQYENALKESNHEILAELKLKIEQSNEVLHDGETVKHIQQQIHRRKSKRARLRRQKQTKLIDIDEDTIEQPPPAVTNEKSVDEKIEDIHSLLRTIEQLQSIRRQRQKDTIPNSNDQLTEIENECTAKLSEYLNEMEKRPQSSHVELCNYLFNNHNQSFYQSTDPDAQDFLRAHQSKHNLIQIRQGWDQYSTTRTSSSDNSLPVGWYEPQSPSDSNWARYISNKHS